MSIFTRSVLSNFSFNILFSSLLFEHLFIKYMNCLGSEDSKHGFNINIFSYSILYGCQATKQPTRCDMFKKVKFHPLNLQVDKLKRFLRRHLAHAMCFLKQLIYHFVATALLDDKHRHHCQFSRIIFAHYDVLDSICTAGLSHFCHTLKTLMMIMNFIHIFLFYCSCLQIIMM